MSRVDSCRQKEKDSHGAVTLAFTLILLLGHSNVPALLQGSSRVGNGIPPESGKKDKKTCEYP